ncbi:hypothetical protein [Adonisia turfae]|uniref:hypothetical protein n=1 Tax=Adonisia turfae TaxID=2950184 RepID=UPI0013D7C793|nr:hypothetical protein [Adonisia turfae]
MNIIVARDKSKWSPQPKLRVNRDNLSDRIKRLLWRQFGQRQQAREIQAIQQQGDR